jgi:Clp amino terminal domain, pathogenicity island component
LDDDVAFEAAAVLRHAVVLAADGPHPLHRRARRLRESPVFSPGVRWAVYEALHEARRCGVRHARPEHLVYGLLTLPGGAANQLLAQWAVIEPWRLIGQLRGHPDHRTSGELSRWAVDGLTLFRVLQPDPDPVILRWPWRPALRLLVSGLVLRPYRRYGVRYGHPLLFMVELHAPDRAAYTGHDHITAAHVLVTMLELHEQLTLTGMQLPAVLARWNSAGTILTQHGVHRQAAARAAARLTPDPRDDEDNYDDVPHLGWHTMRIRRGVPKLGRTALLALRGASLTARRLGHPYAGTSHLLAALLTDPTGPAARLLRELGVDPNTVRSEAEAAIAPPLIETTA